MEYTRFPWHKLLETVLLLLALGILDIAIVASLPFVVEAFFSTPRNLNLFLTYYPWISRIAFGCIIFYKARNMRVAAPIALLSATMPVFGALFYLLISFITTSSNER